MTSSSSAYLNSLPSDDALTGGFFAGFFIVLIVVAIIEIVGMWKMFKKAGEAGWKSIIPIYNLVILFKISGESPWLILLCLIPIASLYPALHQPYMLAKSFGKGMGCTLALIFFPGITHIYLGLGQAQYVAPGGE